jgi:hypothetical protein
VAACGGPPFPRLQVQLLEQCKALPGFRAEHALKLSKLCQEPGSRCAGMCQEPGSRCWGMQA